MTQPANLQPIDLAPIAAPLQQLQLLEAEINARLIEREDPLRMALVSALCGQNLVLLGPPGTAKSLLISLLAQGLNLSRFMQLLTRFTTPEELLGPISVLGMKQDDYRRLTTARMPEAQFVLLDECFKASSAILNTTLTMLNERQFDNGAQRLDIPLLALYGASNELPQGDDLAALWDRFQIRVMVGYVSKANFPKLIARAAGEPSRGILKIVKNNQPATAATPAPAIKTVVQPADLFALMQAVAYIPIPPAVQEALVKLYGDLEGRGITISDRRWEQSLDALRAHALLEGRGAVESDDILIMRHMFWSTPEQRQELARMTAKLANPFNASAIELGDQAESVYQAVMGAQKGGDPSMDSSQAIIEGNNKLKKISRQLRDLADEATRNGRNIDRIKKIRTRVRTMHEEIASLILSADDDL